MFCSQVLAQTTKDKVENRNMSILDLASLKVYSGAWHAAKKRGCSPLECKGAGNAARKELLATVSYTELETPNSD